MADIDEDIVANADDGYEFSTFTGWYDTSSSISVGRSGSLDTHIGARFQAIAIDKGVTIDLATITWHIITADSDQEAEVFIDDVDNAAVFEDGNLPSGINQTGTPTTLAAGWGGSTGDVSVTVTDQVQQGVNRAGWLTGQDMRFGLLSTNVTGKVVIEDHGTAPSESADLAIDWTAAAGGIVVHRRRIEGI